MARCATSDGVRLRTIITRPAGTSGKLPAIFLAQAVSCGSLELPADRRPCSAACSALGDGLIRVERAGTGDSEGPACSELDYDTEVRHYREALDQLSRHPWVDPVSESCIYGSSLGSTTAPLIAQGRKVAGIVVQGGGALTYLERMINFDRLYLERSGKYRAGSDPRRDGPKRIAFQQAYLIGQKTPEQMAARAARPGRRLAVDPRRRRGPAPLWPPVCLALAGGGQELPRGLGEGRGAGAGRLCRV